MPDAQWLNATNVQNALNDTSREMATLDRALVRRFTQMFRFGHFEKPYAPTEIPAAEHGAISRRMGQQMAVLLKNDAGRLPLAKDAGKVLIVGMDSFAQYACQGGGGGSSKVDPLYTVDPLPGMEDVLRDIGSDASQPQAGRRRARPVEPGRRRRGRQGGRRRGHHGRPDRHRGRRHACPRAALQPGRDGRGPAHR
ncbi:glycoside hydrolase family 3 C-terminal domain-containing protein [Propioniciclava sp. MC1683]|uniref:glycoside hydrolase family 3 C-terminal domain-containing protein n=1 Tax=Propioniciclava sp. MC1683 TaxID=2760309 RepID=UPI0021029232|nr:glycoside hydrolase family 3 C-terminal domain-containing protein [Propioniciclava sp. MC1683]